jgi:hypothetical protein
MILSGIERIESEGEGTEGDDVESGFGEIAANVDPGISKSLPLYRQLGPIR